VTEVQAQYTGPLYDQCVEQKLGLEPRQDPYQGSRLPLHHPCSNWSGVTDSNRDEEFGKLQCYHYINTALKMSRRFNVGESVTLREPLGLPGPLPVLAVVPTPEYGLLVLAATESKLRHLRQPRFR
jgi:hypothetical protein